MSGAKSGFEGYVTGSGARETALGRGSCGTKFCSEVTGARGPTSGRDLVESGRLMTWNTRKQTKRATRTRRALRGRAMKKRGRT